MKKQTIVIISLVCALVLGAGSIIGLYIYEDSQMAYTVNDTLPDGQGKKATVILLAGQSNASGCSLDEYLQKNVSPEKYAEYEAGYDNVYINYFASGNNQSDGFVKCSVRQGEEGTSFGPELGLAEKLNEMYPDRTFFIIKYAWGATDLFDRWLSPSSDGNTGDLYKHFVKYVKLSIKYLISKNYDVEIEGMCWMQGESDSFSVEHGINYEIHLSNFIKDLRKEFSRYSATDGIAFIDAMIADNPMYWVYCDLVNESKRRVADSSPMNVLIDTQHLITTEEPVEKPDIPHYDSLSQLELGYMFAEELSKFFE